MAFSCPIAFVPRRSRGARHVWFRLARRPSCFLRVRTVVLPNTVRFKYTVLFSSLYIDQVQGVTKTVSVATTQNGRRETCIRAENQYCTAYYRLKGGVQHNNTDSQNQVPLKQRRPHPKSCEPALAPLANTVRLCLVWQGEHRDRRRGHLYGGPARSETQDVCRAADAVPLLWIDAPKPRPLRQVS